MTVKEGTTTKLAIAFNTFTQTQQFGQLKVARMFWSEGSTKGGRDGTTIPAFFRLYGNINLSIPEPSKFFILVNDAKPFKSTDIFCR